MKSKNCCMYEYNTRIIFLQILNIDTVATLCDIAMTSFKQFVVLFVIFALTAEGNCAMILCCNRFIDMSRLLHGLLSLQLCRIAKWFDLSRLLKSYCLLTSIYLSDLYLNICRCVMEEFLSFVILVVICSA